MGQRSVNENIFRRNEKAYDYEEKNGFLSKAAYPRVSLSASFHSRKESNYMC